MVGSIKIRVHAHNPSLPLTEAVSYIGSPSSVFVYDVPKKIGTWQITDVAVSVYYPDNSFATVAAKMSAEGVWVATIPACELSGRIRNGFRILASGIDEDGEPVSGYVLGVGDLAVCKLFPAPAPDPGEKAYILRYFDTAPVSPKKGDVAPIDDTIKFYDGTQWVAFGSDVDLSDYYTKEETDALFDDYYTAEETDEAIDRLAAYYITYNAAGAAFPTRAALLSATTYYSGGVVRTPTRNDYAVVLADETHDGAEYRYIYAVADGETVGQWEAQYPIETNDYAALSHKPQINGFELTGNKSATDLNLVKANDGESSRLMLLGGIYDGYQYGIRVLTSSGADIQIELRRRQISGDTSWVTVGTQTLQKTTGTVALQGDIHIDGITVNGNLMPITNKVVNIPVPVVTAPSTEATAEGKAADAKSTGDALAGKLAKSGDTAVDITFAADNAHTVEVSSAPAATGTTAALDFRDPATDYTVSLIIGQGGQVAIKHGNITEGNIPEFDSQKRLVDSGKKVTDFAAASELHYALGPTITASATLADRTMNKVEPLDTNTDDIELSFPPATNGKARDFLVLINNPTGNTGAITFDLPAGATIYGDGLQQTFAEGETWEVTITEVAVKQFYCKAVKMEATVVPPPYWGLYFEAEEPNVVVNMAGKSAGSYSGPKLMYSTDGTTWTSFDMRNFSTPITLANVGDRVYFKSNGTNTQISEGFSNDEIRYFTLSGKAGAHGNIMSLLKGNDPDNVTITGQSAFVRLFNNCTNLTSAPELPATTLSSACYGGLFYGCTSLRKAPNLPATTLTNGCYYYMFQDCTSLTRAPALPVTTLADYCYEYMFRRCTSLTVAPELPATTMTPDCYHGMFEGCTALTAAPNLPATAITDNSYSSMFNGCSSLASISVALTSWGDPSGYSSYNWVTGVAATGTFKCPSSLGTQGTIARGENRCPNGWTVVNV